MTGCDWGLIQGCELLSVIYCACYNVCGGFVI